MPEFSEKLIAYFDRAGVTENYIAKVTGFSRSYVARIKNGDRIPSDTGKMRLFFDALQLSDAEWTEMQELYMEKRMGKKKYASYKTILNFIASFHRKTNLYGNVLSSTFFGGVEIPAVQTLKGIEDIAYMIRLLVEREIHKEKGHIRVFAQSNHIELVNILKYGLRVNQNFYVEHILCLEKPESGDDYLIDNIRIFEDVIPVILSNRGNYDARYYYDHLSAHYNQNSIMPYFIVVDDMVLMLSYDFEHAILQRDPEVVELYKEKFDTRYEKCHELYKTLKNETEIIESYYVNCIETGKVFTFSHQPCFGLVDLEDLIPRLAMQKEHGDMLLKMNRERRRDVLSGKQVTYSYCSKDGIDSLVEYGIVEALPAQAYKPLDYIGRIMTLQGLLKLIEMNQYHLYIMKSEYFHYPENIEININDLNQIMFYYNFENVDNTFLLQENTMAKNFYEFAKDFKEYPFVLSEEESTAYIRNRIDYLNELILKENK